MVDGGVRSGFSAVAFGAAAAEDAADDREAKAGGDEETDVGESSDEVREEEDNNTGVDEDGEDAAQCALRHETPPGQGRREVYKPRLYAHNTPTRMGLPEEISGVGEVAAADSADGGGFWTMCRLGRLGRG